MKKNRQKDKAKQQTVPLAHLPDFIIIGAQKGGTSSLFSYLKQHSQLQLPNKKEIHFFDNHYLKGVSWYRSHFPLNIFDNNKTGEASPYYLFHPHAPQRVFQHCPKVKLIVMLRNPTDRAYSHYMMQNKRKFDPLHTFEEAIAAEESRLRVETLRLENEPFYNSVHHQRLSYLERGKYYTQLNRWFLYFQTHQFLFIKSEIFFDDPLKELQRVYAFLDIKKENPPDLSPQNVNDYEPMKDKTRGILNEYFADENKKLAGLLGNDFLWDS
ncbi:MAG: sulfotransferase domain-containing protein [Bacteroidales bacterium]|nr:sulfotransferase domain-containing protein [Bacteroidales bacterium]